ncbi:MULTISPECIES: YvrJ family protein [Rossellomorea]|nr:YvrJ family protein [Rossellomorea marisflavi]KQU58544.1 ribonuclease Z [Bacillus sp. Leaf406]MBV6684547.1 YvrJ family protein [Bacillus sp. JRC01]VXB30322.1 Ribonuclease Z [Bacillus sp. 349Y]KMK95818.1 ribonuclease Z [Rossellomorea marisflavi]KML01226.1 ribonuclease Z [Rossellomorea marisflavi]
MDYSVFVQLLGNFGFPIAVTLFLLVKLEKKLEQLEQAIQALSQTFSKEDRQ